VLGLENIEKWKKNKFLDLAHKKFGKSETAETRALDEALDLWIQSETDSITFSTLLDDLKSSDSSVTRKRAAFKLGKYDNRWAVNALIKALDDKDTHVRRSSTASLGKIGNDKAIKQLVLLLGNEDSNIKITAEGYLSYMGEKTLDPLLNAQWSSNKNIRALSASVLGKIGYRWRLSEIIDTLCECMNDDDDIVRWRAAAALGDMGVGSPKSIKTLLDSFNDPDIRVRRNAIKSIGFIGDKEALVPLIIAQKDDDLQIRENADEAWQKIIKRLEED